MLQQLVSQFIATGAADETIGQVTEQTGLDGDQARQAVEATAEGAADATTDGGGIASLLGGGGLGALAGSLLGGGTPSAGGLPPQLVQRVTQAVAQKTGLSPAIAGAVVNLALPKVVAFFQGGGEAGGDDAGSGGLLGGLLGR